MMMAIMVYVFQPPSVDVEDNNGGISARLSILSSESHYGKANTAFFQCDVLLPIVSTRHVGHDINANA